MATFHGRMPEPPIEKPSKTRAFGHGQVASMVLAGVLFLYGFFRADVALAFLTASFLLFMLRPLAERFLGVTLGNVMKGLAMGMGFGALVLAFF